MLVHKKEGDKIPWGYGLAWPDYNSETWVCLPVGVNLVARGLRRVFLWAALRYSPDRLDQQMADAFQRGYQQGFRMGIESRSQLVEFPDKES